MPTVFFGKEEKNDREGHNLTSEDFGLRNYFGRQFYFMLKGRKITERVDYFLLGTEMASKVNGEYEKMTVAPALLKAEVHKYRDDTFYFCERHSTSSEGHADRLASKCSVLIHAIRPSMSNAIRIDLDLQKYNLEDPFSQKIPLRDVNNESPHKVVYVVSVFAAGVPMRYEEPVVNAIRSAMERAKAAVAQA